TGQVILRNGTDVGRIFLRDGHICFAASNDEPDIEPHKVLYRLLRWTTGTFEMERADDRVFAEEIKESTEALLLEGMHQLDELKNLGPDLPPLNAQIELARPLPGRLAELEKRDLDFLQLV